MGELKGMKGIKKGSLVTIQSIKHTDNKHGRDDGNVMSSMVGGKFTVDRVDTERVYIEAYNGTIYVWNINDISPVEDEPDPIMFKFDDKQLIV